jgi:radical SAM superfamily enzyme YgiQ (UPF0313 family)
MNVLMIEVPTEERDGSVPVGILYAASSALRLGHRVKIIDLVKEPIAYAELSNIIHSFLPDVIGMGGITSSYKNAKELIASIKQDYVDIPVIAGGVISSVADLLLNNAGADFVVHGEGEITFPRLLDAIKEGSDLAAVKGISYKRDGMIVRTDPQPPIADLDDIPMPAYDLLDMGKYLDPIEPWINAYFQTDPKECEDVKDLLANEKYLFPIITARGCTHRCIFCYRHHKGLRQHSVDYVISMMKFLRNRYGVGLFQINDELTTANRKWVLDFCDALKRGALNIHFIILSSRVDTVDETILRQLKDAGCLMINYGYESGSDTILKEIRKGVKRDQALAAGLLTKKVGIKNVPEIIIGFPSETDETVDETIDFLKQLDTWPVSINSPIPFPETPLWQYAVDQKLIVDKEAYVLGYRRGRFLNFTKYPDRKVLMLVSKVRYETHLHWLRHRKAYMQYVQVLLEKFLSVYIKPHLNENLYRVLRNIYSRWMKSGR